MHTTLSSLSLAFSDFLEQRYGVLKCKYDFRDFFNYITIWELFLLHNHNMLEEVLNGRATEKVAFFWDTLYIAQLLQLSQSTVPVVNGILKNFLTKICKAKSNFFVWFEIIFNVTRKKGRIKSISWLNSSEQQHLNTPRSRKY